MGHDVSEFTVMKFLRDNWTGIERPELAAEIFRRHFHPFIGHLWSGCVPPHVTNACLDLERVVRLHAVQTMNRQAHQMRRDLTALGLIPDDPAKSLAQIACEFGLNRGLDHVLVGMRGERYADDLRDLFVVRENRESLCL